MSAKGTNVVIIGTGFDGRADVIRRLYNDGAPVKLQREPEHPEDSKAIAVYLKVPTFLGLSSKWAKIGYFQASKNKRWSEKIDQGIPITVSLLFNHPCVTDFARFRF